MEPPVVFEGFGTDTPTANVSLNKNDPHHSSSPSMTSASCSDAIENFTSESSGPIRVHEQPKKTLNPESKWGILQGSTLSPRFGAREPSKILPTVFPVNSTGTIKEEKEKPLLTEKTLSEMGFQNNAIEGWEEIVQPVKEDLYEKLREMVNHHIKPDVQIRIGTVMFNCHMMVLQCYSDFFIDCSNEMLIQLPEEKVTAGSFMMIYDWMLAEQPLVQRDGILELFNAATFLRIKSLINQCWLCLDDDVRFREDTAFMLYLEARTFKLEAIEQLMLTRICKFFLTLVASQNFLDLNADEMFTLLSSNTVGVNSEIEIFMSLVRWLNYDWEERKQHLLRLVKCVRFTLMPPWFLIILIKPTEAAEVDKITEVEAVKRIITDSISYTSTQMIYGDSCEEFYGFLERNELNMPMQRQWIYDKECFYHHRIDCGNMQHVTYKSFLQYLDMIQSMGKQYWHTLAFARGNEPCCGCSCIARSASAETVDSDQKDTIKQ